MTSKKSPAWSYAICLGLVAVAFFMFVFFLDRYPPFYFDEPAFNASAARYVSGQSFVYPLHTAAPHKDSVWAYHGPFFPRMQVLTFSLLGVSHWACRIPGYLGGHLAVLVLCLLLLRYGFWKSAVGVAGAWIGDRATQLIILGRPDGVSHLLVVIGYVFLVDGLIQRSLWRLGLSATFTGLAIGFNPGAVFFGFALIVALIIWVPREDWPRSIGAMTAGVILPAILFLVSWLPSIGASFEQFKWYVYESTKGGWVASVPERFMAIWHMPFWSKYWILALACTLPLLLVRRMTADKDSGEVPAGRIVSGTALLFGLAAVGLFLNSSMHAYYFVFFTIWPLCAMLCAWEGGAGAGKWRPVFAVWAVLIVAAWLPSFAWNAGRFREALLDYRKLGKDEMITQMSERIPEGSAVTGDPVCFVVAHKAGLSYTPLPFFDSDPGLDVPGDKWCLVGSRYLAVLDRRVPGWRDKRDLLYAGVAFKESYSMRWDYFIYGPEMPMEATRITTAGEKIQ